MIAFVLMTVNSLFLASLLLMGAVGMHMSSEVFSVVAAGTFFGALFIGTVWVIGGIGGGKMSSSGNLDSSNVMGYYGGDSCDSGGDC